jgi:Sulfatase-modifying factor enzyme 1
VLVNYLDTRAGLLIAGRERLYAFPHRSFQEYLAACYLANRVADNRATQRLSAAIAHLPRSCRIDFRSNNLRKGLSVDDERPPHSLELPAFPVGQFPVTNAEYACFIEAGGYRDNRYWDTPRGLAWLRGELESEASEDWLQWWCYFKENPTRSTTRSERVCSQPQMP